MDHINRFNNWLAVQITSGVSTMWCAYAFILIAVVGFPYGSNSAAVYVQWLSQTLIQLSMLSIICVGQKLAQDAADNRHADLKALHDKHDAHTTLLDELKQKIDALLPGEQFHD